MSVAVLGSPRESAYMPEISRFYGIVIGMYWSVASAKYLDGYRLEVTFEDGKSGVVDFKKFIRKGGVFQRLADVGFFKQFHINPDFGVICWGDDLDIAPESVYQEATGIQPTAAVAEGKGRYSRKR